MASDDGCTELPESSRYRFVVDTLMDQELHLEVCHHRRDKFVIDYDEMLYATSITVAQLARSFAAGEPTTIRVCLRRGDGADSRVVYMELSGTFKPLAVPTAMPAGAALPEVLLLLNIDCIIRLNQSLKGRSFYVRARLTTSGHGQVSEQQVDDGSCTKSAVAGPGMVAHSRAQNLLDRRRRWNVAKAQLRILLERGGRLSPSEVSWILPHKLSKEEATQLIHEVQQEIATRPGEALDVNANLDEENLELLFGSQLRLDVADVYSQGLLVELVDAAANKAIGVVEWSSLAWLVQSDSMQEDVQSYVLQCVDPESAFEAEPRLYMKRQLRFAEEGVGCDELFDSLS
eukprot:NODE_3987_length_1952_cov_3.391781.p1 GENE.NODE_3987_length_1952_cov_3.391781~~NODE_3987_length_1952_cov_3.391781.p1  ORF type:complete len:345 (+),score=101.91 NODE_3987_length_1952_cov_3.391781:572-1606(+)